MFEFNIRFIGGLLSAYALSGDEVNGRDTYIMHDHIHILFGMPHACNMYMYVL